MIKMTKNGYLDWIILWDAIYALHKYGLRLLENGPIMVQITNSQIILI